MGPESKSRYLGILDNAINSGRQTLRGFEQARKMADSRVTSRYDTQRENFNQDVNLQLDKLDKLNLFKDVISRATPQDTIEIGAEFSAELWDQEDTLENIVYSPISVKVDCINTMTPNSPIGNAVRGMRKGNTFVYTANNKLMAGIITKVE